MPLGALIDCGDSLDAPLSHYVIPQLMGKGLCTAMGDIHQYEKKNVYIIQQDSSFNTRSIVKWIKQPFAADTEEQVWVMVLWRNIGGAGGEEEGWNAGQIY